MIFHISVLVLITFRCPDLTALETEVFAFWTVVLVTMVLYLKTSLMDPGYWPLQQPTSRPEGTFVVLVEDRPLADQENIATIRDANTPSENIPTIRDFNSPCENPNDLSKQNLVKHETESGSTGRFCSFCKISQQLRTKHCRDCNKCVALYDHHCPWIGGCVGQNNRFYFFWYVLFQCIELWMAEVYVTII